MRSRFIVVFGRLIVEAACITHRSVAALSGSCLVDRGRAPALFGRRYRIDSDKRRGALGRTVADVPEVAPLSASISPSGLPSRGPSLKTNDVEVLSTERRRRWSAAEKVAMVRETYEPGDGIAGGASTRHQTEPVVPLVQARGHRWADRGRGG